MRTTASGTPAHTPESPRFTPGPWHEHSHRQIGPDAGIVCEAWAALDLFRPLKAVSGEISEGISTNPATWLPAQIAQEGGQ